MLASFSIAELRSRSDGERRRRFYHGAPRPRWIAKGRDGTTLVFGGTMSGRLLLIVTVDEGDGVAFVVTAREMTEQEKRIFHRKAR